MVTTEPMRIRRTAQPQLEHPAAAPVPSAHTELILSAIETGQYTKRERRCVARARIACRRRCGLFSDEPNTPAVDSVSPAM